MHVRLCRSLLAVFACSIAAAALAPAAGAAAPKHRGPVQDPKHGAGRSTSTNWSGYDVTGSGASHVIGTWTQPSANCSPGENSWSSPWVGIDGDTSNTVEQIGTDSDCNNGTPYYYAWYEMYPKSLVQFSLPVAIGPGRSYTGDVTAHSDGTYVLKLTDNGTGQSFTTTQRSRKSRNASAEWIMEGPSNGLLTDFGTVSFTGASATINGGSGSLTQLGAQPITMVSSKGATRAQPSSASRDSFSVRFVAH